MQKITVRSVITNTTRKMTQTAFNLLPSIEHEGRTLKNMGFIKLKGEPVNLNDLQPTFDEGDSNEKDINKLSDNKGDADKVETAISNNDYQGVTGNELSNYIKANFPDENSKQSKRALFDLLTEKIK